VDAAPDLVVPQIELGLIVELVGELPPLLEVRAQEAVRALERVIGLDIASLLGMAAIDAEIVELGAGGGRSELQPPALPTASRLLLRATAAARPCASHAPELDEPQWS
jgi:hypothetical protein